MHVNKVIATITPDELATFKQSIEDKQAAENTMKLAMDHAHAMMSKAIRDQNQWWVDMAAKYGFEPDSTTNIVAKDFAICQVVTDPAIAEAERLVNSDIEDDTQ